MLTLVGTAGVGKTRLALRLAADHWASFRHGAWLVELAPISDAQTLPRAIAAVLGVREQLDEPLNSTLMRYLRPRHLLLVLDNCEHLLDSCATLVEQLLHGCPELHVLVTSREPLRIAGERAWRVPPLAIPPSSGVASIEQAMDYEAVQLFVERAQATQPEFRPSAANASALAEICCRLDGIPLAIELASALVQALPLEQIAQRLDDRFRLLTTGRRTASPRHRTLLAAVDWSYGLLERVEQRLFARLSVFAGSFSLEAVETVCEDNEIDRKAILEVLGRLVAKSLVQAELQALDARYRLLDTLRAYASTRLDAMGQAVDARERHLAYYLSLSETAEPQLLAGQQMSEWLTRLEGEHDNLRAALQWCLDTDKSEAALRLSGALSRFWLVRGYLVEGFEWLDRVLVSAGSSGHTRWRAKALAGAGFLALFQGKQEIAWQLGTSAVALWCELGDQGRIAFALQLLAPLAERQGYTELRMFRQRAIAHSQAAGNRVAESLHLMNLGATELYSGNLADARRLLEKALALAGETGYAKGRLRSLQHLANLEDREARRDIARRYLEESLKIGRRVGDRWEMVAGLLWLGWLATTDGNDVDAQCYLAEAVELCRALGYEPGLVQCLRGFAALASARRNTVQALRFGVVVADWREPMEGGVYVSEWREWWEAELRNARRRLGEAAVADILASGQDLSIDHALAEALQVDAPTDPDNLTHSNFAQQFHR
jgi:non-specific serine/threonine protein kinase